MRVPVRYRVVGSCLALSLACIQRTEPPAAAAPPPVIPEPSPAAVTPKAAPAPPPPTLDDPRSCVDAPVEEERETLALEMERRIVERSEAVRSCVRAREGVDEVNVQVELLADGATLAKVTGTSLPDCAQIACVRQTLSGLQVAPPQADRKLAYQWFLQIGGPGPLRLSSSNQSAEWFAKAPPSSTACLDALPAESGRLPPEVIRRIVRNQYGAFRRCYEEGLKRYSDLEGSVTVRFVIDLDGTVSDASIYEATLPDCAVASCMRDTFEQLRFPAPEGGSVTVQYPIMLQPG